MGFIKRCWKGEEKLWKVFWIYGILLTILLSLIWIFLSETMGAAGYGLIALFVIYTIWLCVSQWRCAFNADWKIWGYVVRILLVLNMLSLIAMLALGGLAGGLLYTASQSQDTAVSAQPLPETAAQQPPAITTTSSSTPEDTHRTQCIQTMRDHAIKNNADADAYVAQNQAYIEECVKYHMSQGTGEVKQ